jgi:capsular exopolysaccharide synthesis family protein
VNAPENPSRPEPGRQSGTLRDYLRLLRRRKWVVLLALILVPAVAVALSTRQSPRYEAQAQVLLTHQSLAALLTNTQDPSVNQQLADRNATTQADLARVPTVLVATLASVPGSHLTPFQLLHSSSVSAGQNSDLLTFAVIAKTPGLALKLATAYAGAYTDYRHRLDTAALQLARQDVGRRIAELRLNHRGRSALAAKLAETQQQLQTLQTLETSNATVVKTPLRAPQVSPQPIRNGLFGLAFGVIIGLGLALLVDALDTRVRSGDEIAARLGIPLLGRLPEPPRKVRARQKLVMLAEPHGRQAEAFRMLRTNLELANIDEDVKIIAVASALPSEGKSTTVANLAIAAARGGQRVALVDLDLRKPMLATFFEAVDPWGVIDVALGRVSLADALLRMNVAGLLDDDGHDVRETPSKLDVLFAGRIPPNPGEFISSRRLADILAQLRADYDLVLIDTPPMLSVGDTLALSAQLDALMLVSNLPLTRRGELHELVRTLAFARCEILGTVLTGSGAVDGYGYGYGYGYGHGQHTSDETRKQARAEAQREPMPRETTRGID